MSALASFYDIVILGGGPSGVAAALKIKEREPFRSILLIERSTYEKHRIGESLPPGTRTLLEELGAWEMFQQLKAKPTFGIQSAWGSSTPNTNDFLFNPSGHGWVINRQAFDLALMELARSRGIEIRLNTHLISSEQDSPEKWNLSFKGDLSTSTSFVIDATGRSASFARKQGAEPIIFDQLVGIHGIFAGSSSEPTLIEAFPQGWWYSTTLPNDQRLAACFTDSDTAQELKKNWLEELAQAPATHRTITGKQLQGTLRTTPAQSQRLDHVTGDGWLAVGDASSAYDPLSSQGIFKGLRSGIFAAYAYTSREFKKYERFTTEEFESYLETRTEFYRNETRWSDKIFWQRRLQEIELHPETVLHAEKNETIKRLHHFNRAQTNATLKASSTPIPAHHLVSLLQNEFHYLSATRIILGLQHLIQANHLTPTPSFSHTSLAS